MIFGWKNTLKIDGVRVKLPSDPNKNVVNFLKGNGGRQTRANVLFQVAMRNLDAPGVKKAIEMGAKIHTNIRFDYDDSIKLYYDGNPRDLFIHPPLRVALENNRPDIFEILFLAGERRCWISTPHYSPDCHQIGPGQHTNGGYTFDIVYFAAKHNLNKVLEILGKELLPYWQTIISAYRLDYANAGDKERVARGNVHSLLSVVWEHPDKPVASDCLREAERLSAGYNLDSYNWEFAQAYAMMGDVDKAYSNAVSTMDVFILLWAAMRAQRFDFADKFAKKAGYSAEDVKRAAKVAIDECLTRGNPVRAEEIATRYNVNAIQNGGAQT